MANMPKRILVAYASEFGSTGEIATTVAERLHERGASVDVRQVVDVCNLCAYQAVIVGSAIYNGAWLPEAEQFVRFFAAALATMPVAYFAVSMTMRNDTPENRQAARSFLDPVLLGVPEVVPLEIGLFAGSINVYKLPWSVRTWMRLTTQLRHGDYRNWQTIWAWTDQLWPALQSPAAKHSAWEHTPVSP